MVYTNSTATAKNLHGLFESSKLESTDVGRIYDALVVDNTTDLNTIDIDNGVAVKIGVFTGNGLQEVYATVAATTDKIAVTGNPANVKEAYTSGQAQPYNYYIPAGQNVKAYSVKAEYDDIFAVASYQFTDDSAENVAVGNYVVVDGNGAWVAQTDEPDSSAYGFIGQIHSISTGNYYTIVRILVLQNEDIA